MENGRSLINFGEWSKTATILIEKISDALGGYFKPWQIRRVACAEADADKIRAIAQVETQIEITDLTRRALGRFLFEETKKQDNIESITSKAIPLLEDSSKPQEISDDWITNFFDKCRLISDEDMQNIQAKVLSGEANSPGKYSKRTVNFLGSLDKSDAAHFTDLRRFAWVIGDIVPLVLEYHDDIYNKYGVTFDVLRHFDDIGLIRFETLTGFQRTGLPKMFLVFYYGTPTIIKFKNGDNNVLGLGKVMFSKIGKEILPICGSKPIPSFLDYVINYWINKGLTLSSPYPLVHE